MIFKNERNGYEFRLLVILRAGWENLREDLVCVCRFLQMILFFFVQIREGIETDWSPWLTNHRNVLLALESGEFAGRYIRHAEVYVSNSKVIAIFNGVPLHRQKSVASRNSYVDRKPRDEGMKMLKSNCFFQSSSCRFFWSRWWFILILSAASRKSWFLFDPNESWPTFICWSFTVTWMTSGGRPNTYPWTQLLWHARVLFCKGDSSPSWDNVVRQQRWPSCAVFNVPFALESHNGSVHTKNKCICHRECPMFPQFILVLLFGDFIECGRTEVVTGRLDC